jgi:hypothetical protein
MSAQQDEDIADMIADCEKRSSKLSDWELQFIDSISVQRGRGKALTGKQVDTLTAIWDRVA